MKLEIREQKRIGIIGNYIAWKDGRRIEMSQDSNLISLVILYKINILVCIASFTISIYETGPQFKWYLMTHLNRRKRYQRIRTIKTFELENTKSVVKCRDHWFRKKNMSVKSYIHIYHSGGSIYLQNLPLILILQINW